MKKLNFLILATFIMVVGSCKKDKYQEKGDYPEMGSSISTISSWNYSSPSYYGDIINSSITQEVLDNGAVLVYYKTSSNSYTQLPVTFYLSSSYSSTLEVVTLLGGVRIIWTDSDLLQPATPPAMTFKVVVFTPKMLQENPNLDLSNYEEVKSVLNLKN